MRDTTATTDTPMPKPGRPRSARAHQAILDAALELLAEEGFEGMSVEGIAARAGVGKTTIYRRWATKEDVIIEAIRSIHAQAPVIDTGNLRDDLLALVKGAEREAPRSAIERLLPRALSLAQTNPAVFEVYRDRLIAPRLKRIRELVERAIARGEVRADLDPHVAVDMFAGTVFFRLMLARHVTPTPPDFAEQVVDTIWRGIAAR